MKKIVLTLGMSALALYATNGDNLIGNGSKSRAMGGVGIATYFGAENTLSNPALLSYGKNSQLDVGVMYFAPTIKTGGTTSDADKNFIPHVTFSQGKDGDFSYGIGVYGSAGMGVDFRNSGNPSLMEARTNLILMKVTPNIAYQKDNFSFGFAPIIQYGSLNISYSNTGTPVGNGKSDDYGFGYKLGAAYDVSPQLRIGLTYQSAIAMHYKDTLSVASAPFVPTIPNAISDDLEQPQEYGIGFSYDKEYFNISADYKKIKWGSSDGYKDFGWVDQNVYAIGAKYEKEGTWFAVGYNHAKNPITNNYGANSNIKAIMNTFNYIFFPATQEDHYTFGAGTRIAKDFELGLGIVYGVKNTLNTQGVTGAFKVDHSETSATLSLKYIF
ncbi:MAG: outer membrane protein transport protein [Sulfurospirillum sp.]|nr:outer membrane protein transport protein [Sulfurospirillum sp.]